MAKAKKFKPTLPDGKNVQHVVGIDLSLTGTGVVELDAKGKFYESRYKHNPRSTPAGPVTIKTLPGESLVMRIRGITLRSDGSDGVIEILMDSERTIEQLPWCAKNPHLNGVILAVIETPYQGMGSNAVTQLISLAYKVREWIHLCEKNHIETLNVNPMHVKQWLGGKANIKKNEVMMKVLSKYGFEAGNDNEADAYVLAQIGLAYCGLKPMLEYEKAVMDKIKAAHLKSIWSWT